MEGFTLKISNQRLLTHITLKSERSDQSPPLSKGDLEGM